MGGRSRGQRGYLGPELGRGSQEGGKRVPGERREEQSHGPGALSPQPFVPGRYPCTYRPQLLPSGASFSVINTSLGHGPTPNHRGEIQGSQRHRASAWTPSVMRPQASQDPQLWHESVTSALGSPD